MRWLGIAGICITLAASAYAGVWLVRSYVEKQRQAAVKQAGYTIVYALNRWSQGQNTSEEYQDSLSPFGYFPATVEEIVGTEHLPEMPTNPYTGHPMRELSASEVGSAGNLRYMTNLKTFIFADGTQAQERTNGILFMYGPPMEDDVFSAGEHSGSKSDRENAREFRRLAGRNVLSCLDFGWFGSKRLSKPSSRAVEQRLEGLIEVRTVSVEGKVRRSMLRDGQWESIEE